MKVKVKFRIKLSNGDVYPDLFLVKFSGANFGILKISKQVLIKSFKIDAFYNFDDDKYFTKRNGVVIGY